MQVSERNVLMEARSFITGENAFPQVCAIRVQRL
ncbi:unnamed protein product [Chondrus crispus]|uniref:Uncharacterized protein n=1 Tax=Chondrus crispus TaxID=2769 RepID=R7QKH7_CHOCR|nr:unnamed protein product [Chondrus crispus]CDF38579.1 unnamed protein product [Chondrus crispus]|eukprot:XP_005718484.1 unnamed protein product [Chondrus crispus]